MTLRITASLLLALLPILAGAQLSNLGGRLKNKLESKVVQRIDAKVGKAMDDALDGVEGKGKASNTPSSAASGGGASSTPQTEAGVQSYSKFDFVPGEKILYAEDFAQDAVGELPLHWNTTGKGEVVTLNGIEGKWLKMHQNTSYLAANKKEFPKNFTLEFDVVLQFNYKSYTLPLVTAGFLSSGALETTDNELLRSPSTFSSALLEMRPYKEGASFSFYSFADKKKYFESTDQKVAGFEKNYNRPAHVAMQAQEGRLRIWVNSEKIFDMPRALSGQYPFDQLFFKIHTSGYKEDQIGFYISNLKVTTGVPDTRHKLIKEGSFSTTGILFDLGSAVIKPQSYGVVREIAGILKEYPDVKVKIAGHTSSDGDDGMNMQLSKKRAAAVKDLLTTEYGIDAARMSTEGKGETEPVADNGTKEGQSLNRRVAFTKI